VDFLKRNVPIALTGLVLLIIFFIIIGISQTREAAPSQLTSIDTSELIAAHTYVLGSPEAAFSLVVFTDYSSRLDAGYQDVLQELYSENTKYLQVALRHFPQTENAKTAAQAAQIAGEQGKFWEYSQKLYENYSNIKVWGTENYLSLAEEFSLSTEEFAKSLEKKVFEPIIKADIEDAEAFEVKTTPTFFLNETRLEVTGPEDLRQKVLDEIAKIKRLGTEPSKESSSEEIADEGAVIYEESSEERLTFSQKKQLEKTKEIFYTETGWEPMEAGVLKTQLVKWTNNTAETIEIEPLDKTYEDLNDGVVLEPGESFEFNFARKGIWRYQEKNSSSWGSVFTSDW